MRGMKLSLALSDQLDMPYEEQVRLLKKMDSTDVRMSGCRGATSRR